MRLSMSAGFVYILTSPYPPYVKIYEAVPALVDRIHKRPLYQIAANG